MTPNERNKIVSNIMEEHIKKAKNNKYKLNQNIEKDIAKIFSSTAWGFREITLVIALARYMDSNYKASTGFYDCSPRPLYEKSIRDILLKYNIPNRKSGPLNVAKAAVGINNEWAKQRRPADVAYSVVNLVGLIEKFSKEELSNFLTCLLAMFLQMAKRVEELNVVIIPEQDPIHLFILCQRLIDEVPDGGNTPQRIFGLLLNEYHNTLETGITVNNFDDSASTTNTTSNKPGDANEEASNGRLIRIYEITCKKFDLDRIRDSYESIKLYDEQSGDEVRELLVVCREEDCPSDLIVPFNSNFHFGYYNYRDITYYFINIYEWIVAQLLRMDTTSRRNFHSELHRYISDPQTAEVVKTLWKELHQR